MPKTTNKTKKAGQILIGQISKLKNIKLLK